MKVSHRRSRASARLDDQHLVSCAGLVPVMNLAEQAGSSGLVTDQVTITKTRVASCGANPAGKVTAQGRRLPDVRVWCPYRRIGRHSRPPLASLIEQAERCLPQLVHDARAGGHTWHEIAHAVGTSPDDPPGTPATTDSTAEQEVNRQPLGYAKVSPTSRSRRSQARSAGGCGLTCAPRPRSCPDLVVCLPASSGVWRSQ